MKLRGDWLSIYPAGDDDWSFVWRTCWDSVAGALAMQKLIDEQLRETSGGRAKVTSDGADVVAVVRAR